MKKYLVILFLTISTVGFSQTFLNNKSNTFILNRESFIENNRDTTVHIPIPPIPPVEDSRVSVLKCNTILKCGIIMKSCSNSLEYKIKLYNILGYLKQEDTILI